MIRMILIAMLVSAACAVAVEACEYAAPPSAPQEARDRAIGHYESVSFAYEGVLLGPHDFDRGGRFLVLRSYKGPAKPFQILTLPPGNSCYRGLSVFGVWAEYDRRGGMSEFVRQDTLSIWRREKLIGGSVLVPTAVGLLGAVVVIAALFSTLRRRKAVRARR